MPAGNGEGFFVVGRGIGLSTALTGKAVKFLRDVW
jgi:hypothetical protein